MKYMNVLSVGSTRSGKSMAECRRLVEAAEAGCSLVVIDPHSDSLAARLLEHLVARGLQKRILFDRLSDLEHVLGYDFLPKPTATSPLEREGEVESLVRSFAEVLCRRRQITTLATSALTEDWIIPALTLYIEQEDHPPLSILRHAFDPTHPDFYRLLQRCRNQDVVAKFRKIDDDEVGPSQFGAAMRLLNGVLNSVFFAVRCGASFDLPAFLSNRGILILEGSGSVGDAEQTIMGAVILQCIQFIRSRSSAFPPVILTLDEANNANLIGASGFEVKAAAECQKFGLAIHTLVQSLDFPSLEITKRLLQNCLRHEWYFAANADAIRQATADLGSKDYETRIRSLTPGQRIVKEKSRVFEEYVPLIENPWGFPSLLRKKAERALAEIKQRPEYRTPKHERDCADSERSDHHRPATTPLPAPTESDNPNLGI